MAAGSDKESALKKAEPHSIFGVKPASLLQTNRRKNFFTRYANRIKSYFVILFVYA